MTLLARLVLREVALHVAVALFAGLALFFAIDFVEKGNLTEDAMSALKDLALYELYGVPRALRELAPVAVLLGSASATSGLARRNETIAAYAAGGSPLSLLLPALSFGLVFALAYAAMTEWISPASSARASALERKLGISRARERHARETWVAGRSRLYRLGSLEDPSGREVGDVLVLELSDGRVEGRWDIERLVHGPDGWTAEGVERRRFSEDRMEHALEPRRPIEIEEEPGDFVLGIGPPERLSFRALLEAARRRERLGQPSVGHRLELYRRLAYPSSMIACALLGAALVLVLGRRPSLGLALGAAAAIGFLLWLLDEFALALGASLVLPVWAAASIGAASVVLAATLTALAVCTRGA